MHDELSHPQPAVMRRYYRWHAAIYDATRWTFLLGRNALLNHLPIVDTQAQTLLEVGCGTGRNLHRLTRRHPRLQLIGLDVSADMLARASRASRKYAGRIQLIECPYPAEALELPQLPNIVLFSYALSMFNPGWERAITAAWGDLPPGGRMAVVDFHHSPSALFRWWMGKNHVRMEAHLLPLLQSKFHTEYQAIRPAFLGLWTYCMFVGIKPA